jgi:hypothetical protein
MRLFFLLVKTEASGRRVRNPTVKNEICGPGLLRIVSMTMILLCNRIHASENCRCDVLVPFLVLHFLFWRNGLPVNDDEHESTTIGPKKNVVPESISDQPPLLPAWGWIPTQNVTSLDDKTLFDLITPTLVKVCMFLHVFINFHFIGGI